MKKENLKVYDNTPTIKPPKMTKSGMEYNGKVYTRYSELFHTLY